MKKNNKIDLKALSKELGTKVYKTDSGLSEILKLKGKTVKGAIYDDGSGGLWLNVPGLDCFKHSGNVLDQIAEVEQTIAAYVALKPDLKRFKQAIKKAQMVAPTKGKVNVSRRSTKTSK